MSKSHFHEPVVARLGGQTRNLVLDPLSWRKVERALKDQDPVALVRSGNFTAVSVVVAVALLHEGKIDDMTVTSWMRHNKDEIPKIMEAAVEVVHRFGVAAGFLVPLPEAPSGEDSAPSTAGSTSTAP